mgnify:FL=1
MVFWRRKDAFKPHNGGYSHEERRYIKSKMEEASDDKLLKDNLLTWLLQSHPEIVGIDKSLMFKHLRGELRVQMPEYDSAGSLVSGKFVFVGGFQISKDKRFILRFVDPLLREDGTHLHIQKNIELVVRPNNVL